jgi:penicillin-binding protein 1C
MHSRRSRLHDLNYRQTLLTKGITYFIGFIVVCFIIAFALFAWYARSLPAPGKLSQSSDSSSIFYDRDGKVLYEIYKDKNRVPVAEDKISKYLKEATVAIEDKDFYRHGGISEKGILRAFLSIIFRQGVQGGSTITQQLIKLVLLDSSRTPSRKIKEAILAFEVERRYTKDQILGMYLNEVPYGGTIYGIGSSSRAYFGKEPKDLTILESAFLAGLPQNPTNYSPFISGNGAWKGRTKDVLRRMREDKYITVKEEEAALKKLSTMKFSAPKLSIAAPHFVFYVKKMIEEEYGPKIMDQGLKVTTTISTEVQEAVQDIVNEEVKKLKAYNATNGAAVVLDSHTGDILAMVGSYDYNDEKFGQFNAALGLRQPGSTMKPITYALAFEKGYTPSTVVMDVKTVFPVQGGQDYTPVNYDGKFRGPAQLRFALGNSFNVPAVKLLAMVGVKDFLQKAYMMGLSTLAPTEDNLRKFGLSVTLGGGEVTLLDLTNAFSVFANGGIKKDVQYINEIKDYKNSSIFKKIKSKETRVFSPEVSYLVSHILSDDVARSEEFGTGSFLNIRGKTVAVKTGTTDDKRDNWTVGYTKDITVGVWVGNNDNSVMNPKIASGVTGASPIWHNIMVNLLKKYEDGFISKPDKVKALTVDSYLGGLPKDGQPTRAEYFIEGTEPKDVSPFYKKIKVSKSNGKLANEVEVKQGNYDERDFIVFTESDPISTDGKNRWQEAIDLWIKDQGDSKFHPPTETSDSSADSVVVSIKSPNDKATVNSNDVQIRAKISSVAPIKNIKVYINGNEIKNYDGDREEIDETMNLSDGVYELKVVGRNDKDKAGDSVIKFGVNRAWDSAPTGAPSPTP